MRVERDSMGEVQVPDEAYWGASTQRAVDNFPQIGARFGGRFIGALGLVKREAAEVNGRRGIVPEAIAGAVAAAADEVAGGRLDDQFVVGGGVFALDVFQTGSGTSSNMNANEVIANRAAELLGGERGSRMVHPNDHVNACQSSNDVVPTAIHVAAVAAIREDLRPSLTGLAAALEEKAERYAGIVKTGRTHLMDATPVTLGQVFGGYAAQVRKGIERLGRVLPDLEELPLGGTAVGTGLNAPPGWAAEVIAGLASATGHPFREAADHFEAQGGRDAAVAASGALKTVAVSLFKIANDIRWLGSGPRTGLAELRLPALQPGSSIMPGKVNPVVPEMVMQVAAGVIGNDAAITWGGAAGSFELNVMMPLIGRHLLEAIGSLADAARIFGQRCIAGLEPDVERITDLVERNVIIVTALAPRIGYERAAAVAERAFDEGRGVRDVALEMGVLPEDELDAALDLRTMTEGGITGRRA
jgi:fumarate hydratase class II